MKRFINSEKRVSLRQVAELAGVSLACASHSLNGNGTVTEQTRQRVKDAADRLGYWPSLAARALKGSKGKTVLILTDGLAGPWYGELLEGLQVWLVDSGYSVLASTLGAEALALCRGLVADGLVPGLVVLNPGATQKEDLYSLLKRVPSVVFGYEEGIETSIRFALDNRGGMLKLVEHLWTRGCRNYLWLDGNVEQAWDARERWRAFSDFLAAYPETDCRVRRAYGGFRAWTAREALARILDEGALPDAIVAANDESAFGALEVLNSRGLRVPQDVKVTGFDGLEGAAWTSPSLTTLSFDRRSLGRLMAQKLLESMDPRSELNPIEIIPVELVVRSST